MGLCEEKSHYSFVYSSTDRDKRTPGRGGDLAETQLPSVVRLPTWGVDQPGHFDDSSDFYLGGVVVFEAGVELGADALKFVKTELAGSSSRGPMWK